MLIKETIGLSYDRSIWLELLDARSLKITTNCAFVESLFNDNNSLVQLNFANQYEIKVGDTITLKTGIEWTMNYNFIVSQIKQFDGYQILYSHKRTKSSYFMLPVLGYNREWFKWEQFFINTYTLCPEYKFEGDYIYLLYKYMPLKQYNELEQAQLKLSTFVEIIYPHQKDEVIFVHKIDEKYVADLQSFRKGKYSELDDTLKRRILFFHNTNKESEIGHILFKDERRRKQLEMEFKCRIPIELDLLDIPGEEEILQLS